MPTRPWGKSGAGGAAKLPSPATARHARPRRRSGAWKRAVAGAVALATAGTGLAASAALPAVAATVYEIDGRWAEGTPTTQVTSGDVINAEWRVNVNDDQAAPSNDPVDNVTFTTTVTNGRIASVPDLCLTTGVTPVSEISADGRTLTCNVGTQVQGTAAVVMVPVVVDGPSGSEVSMSGEINGQTDELDPIEIQNPFRMDMHWGTSLPAQWDNPANPTYATVRFPWSLRLGAGSEPGPDQVTFRVTTTPTGGAPISTLGCSAFDSGNAGGHPWSGTQTGPQWTDFVDQCVITPVAGQAGVFDVTLRGIDYDVTDAPTHDSSTADGGQGNPLPTDWEYVASGVLTFRVQTRVAGSTSIQMSPVTWTSPTGNQSADLPVNNSANTIYTRPGGWSASWNRANTDSGGYGDRWTDNYRVAPGTQLQMDNHVQPGAQATGTFGMCNVLDSKYVTYDPTRPTEIYVGNSAGWNPIPAPLPGVVEYYVGGDPLVDPNSAQYDPDTFTCGATSGWTTTPPANPATVKAVRWQFPVTLFGTLNATNGFQLSTFVTVGEDVPSGTDVWMFGTRTAGGVWNAGGGAALAQTPDARYPFTNGRRDIVRIVVAEPRVEKAVDRAVVRPGVAATYTLNYSANGAGQIPEVVDDFRIVDTLPLGMTYVAGTANPEPAVSTDGQGRQVLTWELDGVTTNAQHALTYQAVASGSVEAGEILTNTATASLGSTTSQPANAQVTVSTSGTTTIGKTTDQWFIANPDGDGSGEEGSWTITLKSEDPTPQAFTDTIDILPFNGDNRGTAFSGTYDVTSVNVPAGATVYYTTADPATLSDDPADTSNGTAPGSTAGNTVGWSTTPVANPTAIRVIGGTLAPGATFAFTVNIEPDGAQPGDTYVNRAQAIAEHTELVMRTSEPLTMGTAYSASLKKYVQDRDGNWVDANDAAEYPSFRPGESVNYRVVVTNTGQGTITNLEISDDLQPELGSFVIDELLPGEENAYVHEYSIVLEEGGPDTVVNTVCATADQPADSEDPVQINCDPAGFEVDGDPTHTKTIVSATPIGGGQWQVVYGIDVTNTSAHPTTYDLADELHFTPEATIVSAAVTTAPAGVTLASPAWDGQGNTAIAANVPLLGNDDAGYAAHHYEVTVIADVPLQVPGAGSDPDPTACPAEGSDADQGFNNTSQLTDARGETEDDQACAPVPSIDITKTVSAGPVPNGDGTWTVTYDIVATNDGAFEGTYEVTDRMTADGDLRVISGSLTTPDGVTPNLSWTGQGAEGAPENVIASGVVLPAGSSHTYQVDVVLGLVPGTEGAPVITDCAALGEGGPGGLSNAAGIEHNDLTDSAEACITVGVVTVDKSISAGPTPNGDGTWTIVYDLVAENIGAAAADYDLSDRLHYGEGIEILDAEIATAPDGVETNADWTGLGDDGAAENVVATGIELAAGGVHTYQVEVVVEMDEATIDPAVLQCPPPGSGAEGGLANSTSLDSNGIVAQDDVCASLPLIEIEKSISAGPTGNGDGTWTITYDLVATNTGQAAGEYDVRDQLRYGAGIVVESADVVTTPAGVTAEAGWTGQGAALGDSENLVAGGVELAAGGTHTYQVQVVVSLDAATVTPDALACPAPGSGENGGLANTVELEHNGETQDDEACAPLPLIEITKSLSGAVTPVAGQDGVYDVVYEVTATNRGPGAGVYDLDDTLAPGDGVSIVGIQDVTTDAPASVGINPGFDGIGDTRVVTAQPIDGAGTAPVVHTYTITVRYALDLTDVVIDPSVDACTTPDGGTVAGGLNNVAEVDWNGIPGSDNECVRPGKPTLDKALVSANPVGDGKWEVVYDLTVGNVGTEATTYDLDDELLFAPVITVDSVAVTGPQGVTINSGFDGDTDQRIATDVSIAGLDDDGYAPHVYRVTVIANVPLQFTDVADDGTGSPACTTAPGGNFTEQGLNNAATLTDETGGTQTDTDCAPVPSITIAKKIVGDPVKGDDGAWTVNYEITASNDGAAEGAYDLVDRLRYGAGIQVKTATVTATPEGVTASGTWTGQGAEGDPVNVVADDVPLAAGGTHVYQVQVVAGLDAGAVNESTFTCPEPGTDGRGGFANTAGIDHNDLTDSAEACATPDKPGDPGKPGGALATTGATLAWVAGGAALLLLIGALALIVARNRRTTIG